MRYGLSLMACLLVCLVATGQQKADFRAAERFLESRVRPLVKTTSITPNSITESGSFWYKYETSEGARYYFVDPKKKVKREMFDREKVAGIVSELTHEPVDYKDLKLSGFKFDEAERNVSFPVDTFLVRYDMLTGATVVKGQKEAAREEKALAEKKAAKEKKKKEEAPAPEQKKLKRSGGTYSPDKAFCVYVEDDNLFLFRERDGKTVKLSEDGEEKHSFVKKNSMSKEIAEVHWWADSRAFVVERTDTRGVRTIPQMDWHFKDRPTVKEEVYVMPGDEKVPQTELYICDTTSMTLRRLPIEKWKDQKVEVHEVGDRSKLFFTRKRRTCDEMELYRVEPTGEVKVIINEVCEPYFNDQLFNFRLEDNGEEIYWWSERSGYGHYYRYDGEGRLLNAITSGDWTAGKIVRVDTLKGELYFYAYGQVKGECPYFQRLSKARIDGKGEVKMLTPEMATHKVSLTKDYYIVDNYSRADLGPRTVLRDSEGRMVMPLDTADLSQLFAAGWKYPEPIQVKAADGRTDLYGYMWKPFAFDSTRKYPIISYVYPGPQTEAIPLEFTPGYINTALAQVGFVVVTFGHRGGSPLRGKWYHTYGHGNLRDYPLADDKRGLEQLIDRYDFIDGDKVGIYGHSGGGFMTTAAICTYPEFYTAAVASAGNHDNRIYNQWWGETHHGLKVEQPKAGKRGTAGRKVPAADSTRADSVEDVKFTFDVKTNMELAANLKGHLMLVFGDMDTNVHPANTLRMADALMRVGKNFDIVVLPGQNHQYRGGAMNFFQRKMWFHFAKHLLGDFSSEHFSGITDYMNIEL